MSIIFILSYLLFFCGLVYYNIVFDCFVNDSSGKVYKTYLTTMYDYNINVHFGWKCLVEKE